MNVRDIKKKFYTSDVDGVLIVVRFWVYFYQRATQECDLHQKCCWTSFAGSYLVLNFNGSSLSPSTAIGHLLNHPHSFISQNVLPPLSKPVAYKMVPWNLFNRKVNEGLQIFSFKFSQPWQANLRIFWHRLCFVVSFSCAEFNTLPSHLNLCTNS